MLLTVYFFVLGVLAVAHMTAPLLSPVMPEALKEPFALDFTKGKGDDKKGMLEILGSAKTLKLFLTEIPASACGAPV